MIHQVRSHQSSSPRPPKKFPFPSAAPLLFNGNVTYLTFTDSTTSNVNYPNCSTFLGRWACESYFKYKCAAALAHFGLVARNWFISNVNVSDSVLPASTAFYFGTWQFSDNWVQSITLQDINVINLQCATASNDVSNCGGVLSTNSGIKDLTLRRVLLDNNNTTIGQPCASGGSYLPTILSFDPRDLFFWLMDFFLLLLQLISEVVQD